MHLSSHPLVCFLLVFLLSILTTPSYGAPPGSKGDPPSTPRAQIASGNIATPNAPSRGHSKPEQLLKLIYEWAWDNREKLSMAPVNQGGQEGWVQYEFAFSMRKFLGLDPWEATHVVEREVSVYIKRGMLEEASAMNMMGREKADWVFRQGNGRGLAGLLPKVVEFKIESKSKEGHSFVQHVKADIVKASRPNMLEEYQKADIIVIAMTYTKEAAEDLRKIGMQSYDEFQLLPADESLYTFRVWWYDFANKTPQKPLGVDIGAGRPTSGRPGVSTSSSSAQQAAGQMPRKEKGKATAGGEASGGGEIEGERQGSAYGKGKQKETWSDPGRQLPLLPKKQPSKSTPSVDDLEKPGGSHSSSRASALEETPSKKPGKAGRKGKA